MEKSQKDQVKIKQKTKIISNDLKVLRFTNYDTIKGTKDKNIFIDSDSDFVFDILSIAKTKINLISQIFTLNKKQLEDIQCDQIDFKANLHYRANIVNQNTYKNFQDIYQGQRCNCGCQRGRGKQIPLLSDQSHLNILGSGILLLFMFKRTLVLSLLMSITIYASFALITNLMGDRATSDSDCSDQYCHFRSRASEQNKLNPSLYSVVQSWIGVFFCTAWILALRLIKFFGKDKNKDVDEWMNSSSDYAIMIENLPYGQYQQEQLIAFLQCLRNKNIEQSKNMVQIKKQSQSANAEQSTNKNIDNEVNTKGNQFNMKSIQVIYNMEFSRKLIQNIFKNAIILKSFYQEDKKGTIEASNIQEYRKLKKEIIQTYQILKDLRKKFIYDQNFRRNLSTTVALIQFNDQVSKNKFLQQYGNEKIGILKQIQENIKSLFYNKKKLMFKGNILKIQRAPQPSDLLFQNCQKKYSIGRILLIYLITLAIILFSLSLMIGLVYIQDNLSNTQNGQNQSTITILNIIISISLQAINAILWFALFYILQLEYNHTVTQKIISQMNKVLFSTSINIIVLPIFANYVLRNNVYGSEGLAGMVFDYQVSVLTIGLIVKLIYPPNAIKRIILNIRSLRNYVIRFLCKNINIMDPSEGVQQVNKFYQGSIFDVAQSYVYIMAAVYQAIFFCQLQPSLLFLVTIMVFLFYWVNKVKLLRMCKIPEITEILIFQTALAQAAIIPIIYGSGSIVLSYIQHSQNNQLPLNYTPGIICISIGVFSFFNPGDILNKVVSWFMTKFNLFKQEQKEEKEQSEQNSQHAMINDNLNMDSNEKQIQKKGQQVNRIQDYFKCSNALDLFGFQYSLLGKKQQKQIKQQLQLFCKKFFYKYSQDLQLQINQIFIGSNKYGQNELSKIFNKRHSKMKKSIKN